MFYQKKRGESDTLFYNGIKTEEEMFKFDINRYDSIENKKPSLLQQTPLLEDTDDFEDFNNSFGYSLFLETTMGNVLYEDQRQTVFIPRLFFEDKPRKISNFKWYVDGVFQNEELFLMVENSDIIDGSNIYMLEVITETDDGREVVLTESEEIVYLSGVRLSAVRDNDDDDGDDGQFIDVTDDPRNWSTFGNTFVYIEDFTEGDFFDMYESLIKGVSKRNVFTNKHVEVQKRVLKNNLGRNVIPLFNLFFEMDKEMFDRYPQIYGNKDSYND